MGRRGLFVALIAIVGLIAGTLGISPPAGADDSTGSISGVVTADSTGEPLAGICVAALWWSSTTDPELPAFEVYAEATSDVDGTYTLADLAPGDYLVQFSDCSDVGYVSEWYDDVPVPDTAPSVTVTAGQDTPGTDAGLARVGAISGTVVSDSSGAPLSHICVVAIGPSITHAYTGPDGTYTLDDLPPGDYRVFFGDARPIIDGCHNPGYEDENFDDALDWSSATIVTVVDGQETVGVDASLAPVPGLGSISGTVTADDTGEPLAGVCISTYDGIQLSNTTTRPDGTYTVHGLAPGEHWVLFSPCSAGDYRSEYYDNVTDWTLATRVTVTAGQPTIGIDAGLAPSQRSLSGTVTADDTGEPLADICVNADGAVSRSVSTGPDGTYTFTDLPPGEYRVSFSDCVDSVYATEWYDGAESWYDATPVAVVAGQETTGIDAGLGIGARISGIVTADDTGEPLADICVTASGATGVYAASVQTDSSGAYSVGGLAAGAYRLELYDCSGQGYRGEYYDDALEWDAATPIVVGAGQEVSGIDAGLAPPQPSITGTVTDADTGEPLADICVNAEGNGWADTATGPDGTYTLVNLAPGAYQVYFYDCWSLGYYSEYYDDAPDWSSATDVTVVAGEVTTGIDAGLTPLPPPGSITGTVTDAGSGEPLADICVGVDGSVWAETTTGPDGTYTLDVLPGSYRVQFYDCSGAGYAPEYYDGVGSWYSATLVTVVSGQETTGIDGSLGLAGRISGTVTADDTGEPLADVCVTAFGPTGLYQASAYTDVDGTYTFRNLIPDDYRIEFEDCSGRGYLWEYFDDTTDWEAATVVTVVADQETTGIDAGLALWTPPGPGSISGVVTSDDTGLPVEGICVLASAPEGWANASTGADGTYTLSGLPPGHYRIFFMTSCAGDDYQSEYFDDTTDYAAADLVAVGAGQEVTGIDAGLARTPGPGAISGTVTADDTGLPLAGICVTASGPDWVQATTGADGTYAFPDLPPGPYRVLFGDCSGAGYQDEYFDDAPDWGSATLVTVADQETTGIDAGLARSVEPPGRPAPPADFDGDGATDVAVYRPSAGAWLIEGRDPVYLGLTGDIPVPGDYDGNGTTDIAVYRPSVGAWYIEGQPTTYLGLTGDIPVPGDYDADGTTDIAIWRPEVGGWYRDGHSPTFWGLAGDVPVPGDYDADGATDIAIWRPSVGGWYRPDQPTTFWGLASDTPVQLPYAIARTL